MVGDVVGSTKHVVHINLIGGKADGFRINRNVVGAHETHRQNGSPQSSSNTRKAQQVRSHYVKYYLFLYLLNTIKLCSIRP